MIFKSIHVEGTTIGDTWFSLLWNLKEHGRKYLITKGSHEGSHRLAFDDISGVIMYPHERPLAPIMPEASNLPAPTTDHAIEQYFAEYLMNGEIKENEDYTYALWIVGGRYKIPSTFVHNKYGNKQPLVVGDISVPNQIEWIINHFKTAGFGNEHCFLTVGYPESNFAYDIPYTNEQERKTSPCLRGLDFRIIEDVEYICKYCNTSINEEEWTLNQKCPKCDNIIIFKDYKKTTYLTTKVIYRSWDLYGGFPENMGGFTLLNEYVASELGIEPGPLTFTCKSLHCYEHHLEVLNSWTGRKNV